MIQIQILTTYLICKSFTQFIANIIRNRFIVKSLFTKQTAYYLD